MQLYPSKKKFLSLSQKARHKHAAKLLQQAYLDSALLPAYKELAELLNLPHLETTREALSDRYHYHLKMACIHIKEDKFLPNIRHLDSLSSVPFLNIDIYLDKLRSAHNIGSIIRTTEAFRLGEIHFSPRMPYIDHRKIQSSAMGTDSLVTCHLGTPLSSLKRPLIALETSSQAKSIYTHTFTEHCTIMVGNEEFGLSDSTLNEADLVLEIPLQGSKNSLNVASAFAIVAAKIRADILCS